MIFFTFIFIPPALFSCLITLATTPITMLNNKDDCRYPYLIPAFSAKAWSPLLVNPFYHNYENVTYSNLKALQKCVSLFYHSVNLFIHILLYCRSMY